MSRVTINGGFSVYFYIWKPIVDGETCGTKWSVIGRGVILSGLTVHNIIGKAWERKLCDIQRQVKATARLLISFLNIVILISNVWPRKTLSILPVVLDNFSTSLCDIFFYLLLGILLYTTYSWNYTSVGHKRRDQNISSDTNFFYQFGVKKLKALLSLSSLSATVWLPV